MLWLQQDQAFQMRLSQEAKDTRGGAATTPLLLGPSPNRGKDGLKDQGGKRRCQAVNDSTDLAKDLVLSGMHLLPASKAHCTSVVINAHSNIPFHDFTTKTKTKEESKQDIGTTSPTKHLLSNSLQAKAVDDKAPTIVLPVVTVPNQRLDRAREQAPSTSLGEAAPGKGNTADEEPETLKRLTVPPLAMAQAKVVSTTRLKEGDSPNVMRNDGPIQAAISPAEACCSKSPEALSSIKTMAGTMSDEAPEREYQRAARRACSEEELDRQCNICDTSAVSGGMRWTSTPLGNPDEGAHGVARTVGCPMAPTDQPQLKNREAAASTQAVKRGPQVQLEEIPNDEDDTSF